MFLCEYSHGDSLWVVHVPAYSFEDAHARLKRMAYAKVLGTLEGEIPYVPGGSWIATLICWVRNKLVDWRRG